MHGYIIHVDPSKLTKVLFIGNHMIDKSLRIDD